MVDKQVSQKLDASEGVPPPFDESWWESVLAEAETKYSPYYNRASAIDQSENRDSMEYTSPEPVEIDWDYATELYKEDDAISLQVNGFNRGGLLVSSERLQGFVPISHLVDMPNDTQETDHEQFLVEYLERSLHLKVIECDRERGRIVFSERAALAEAGSRNHLLSQLKMGDCVQGVVTNITDFGVFVDLGGVEGLIHVSEISWGRVRHPSDVVNFGDQIEVYVINVDQTRSRVALSLKRLCQNPWLLAEKRYHSGMLTKAIITSVVPFGAFARLEEGLDGLIHISEMTQDDENINPRDVLNEGDQVQVRVLHVDATKQRLGLSLNLNT